ncbi:MAG TPA: PKD domain-containing protein [Thermoguttaceae bacterium]|nr:PKD domain-containing protein [Thermoguttaceae bacterium]
MRRVDIPRGEDYTVVVVQFFHHDEIAPDGRNVLVSTRDQKLLPARVLQLGPGDYCRLAFETAPRQSSYEVLYGGAAPDASAVPPWTAKEGLLLETREYEECNLNSLDSVREAFESSKRIGSDYVANVQHSHNPFSLKPGPFLSRYSGYLRVGSAGTYGFLTSSQDCSFLLVDDKLVVEAPGRHRPERRAKTGSRKDIQLTAGAHKFEYYHAASGPEAMMVAAWEVSPAAAKPKPTAIPTAAFGTAAVGRVRAGPVTLREAKLVPDFLVSIRGDVPLPDNELALIGTRFMDVSPDSLTLKAKLTWDFGDGQTSSEPNPTHVYLRPGLYAVKLSVTRGTRPLEMVNRVYIDRPKILKEEDFHKLDDYLPILQTYDPQKLDAVALRQLVLAYQFKIESILAPPEPEEGGAAQGDGQSQEEPEAKPNPEKVAREAEKVKREREAKKAEALECVTAAVTAGQAPFLADQSAAQGDEDLIKLARLVGPMARDELGDSRLAARIWHGASRKIADSRLKGQCEVQAADIAISDLLQKDVGKSLLEAATAHLQGSATGPVASRLQRVWGDYYAASGDGQNARKSYNEAESVLASTRTHIERTAWQGAHSRSTEQFLKSGELDRAARQLRAWQDEFPAEKIDGYLNLVLAQYWAGRGEYAQAVALVEAQLAVNPDSPHIDQLLVLVADCEVKRGQVDRALAFLNQLLKDYPGSPLVPVVRENIAKLEAGEVEAPKQPAPGIPSRSE